MNCTLLWLLVAVLCLLMATPSAWAQRRVDFPPADSRPPAPSRSPPRQQSSGEDTSVIPEYGPTMRKTQERLPPPPTTLTVMYKLQYGEQLQYVHSDGRVQTFDQWRSFPNDAQKLIGFTNHRLEDGIIYEHAVKPLAADGFDPLDIPLLFMAGDYDFVLTEQEVENLRRFLLDGGTIFFNAARGRDEFAHAVAREMRRVFPNKGFIRSSADHPIFNSRYRISQVLTMAHGVQFTQEPEVYTLDIGTRGAAIFVPWGMGAAWSESSDYHAEGRHLVGESAIRMGVNLIAYVLGSTEYGRFLAQEFPVYDGSTYPGDVVRLAMARYSGSWSVNPALQNTLLQALYDNTGIGVGYEPLVIDLHDPLIGQAPLVFMTGHYNFELSTEEVENLRSYLYRGGTLFASAAAGLAPFDTAFRREIRKVLPDADLVKIPPSHPIFTRGYLPLDRVVYTPPALRDDPTLEYPEFYGCFVDGRLVVLYTPYDLLSGVNRESNAYAKGVTPDDAMKIAINIITYVLTH